MENCGRFVFFLQKQLFLVSCEVKQPALLERLRHFHLYTLIDHSSRPISTRGFAQLL